MIAKLLIFILFFGLSNQTYSQAALIGNWRRVNPKLKYQDTINKKIKWGDFEIRRDSTFHIEGDSPTQNSNISGWHAGDEYNGTWKLRGNNLLTLWLEPKKNKMFLSYMIIKLTKEKLVLRSQFHTEDKRHDITYLRL